MPTTALLVEIVIVGYGFFATITPIISLVFGIDVVTLLTFYSGVPLLIQLSIAYAAGIVWNRMCDFFFSDIDDKMVLLRFPTKKDFQKARIEVIMQGESVRDYIGNFRSLIRVSRALSVLLVIFILCTPIFTIYRPALLTVTPPALTPTLLLEIIFLLISIYGWHRLNKAYVSQIADAHAIVKERKELQQRSKNDLAKTEK